MIVKVEKRGDPSVVALYEDVDKVVDCFDDNGNYCHQLQMGNETATYVACEWTFYKLDWCKMF